MIAMIDVTAANASSRKNSAPKHGAAGHACKRRRQRAKNEARSRTRVQVVAEDQREDHQAGEYRNQRIRTRNDQRGLRQRYIVRHIGAVGHDQPHRHADGKERLADSGQDNLAVDLAEVCTEEEINGCAEISFDRGVADHDDQHHEQCRHQYRHGALYAVFQAATHNEQRACYEHGMPHNQSDGIRQQFVELPGYRQRISAAEAAAGLEDVGQRPAGDHAVVGHDEIADQHAHPANQEPGPGASCLFCHDPHGDRGTVATPTPDPQLGDQDRHSDKHHGDQVDNNERSAAVDADDEREFPDVAETDGGTDRRQDEGES